MVVYREVKICTGKSKLLVDYHNVITARLIQSPPIHKLILENNFGVATLGNLIAVLFPNFTLSKPDATLALHVFIIWKLLYL